MTKPTILAATFVVLFTLAAAFDFDTLFTTSTIFARQNEQGSKCQRQIQKQQQIRSCQNYLRKSTQMSQSSMMINQDRSWREEFPRCCQQLEQIDQGCRCQAITQVLQQLREGLQGEIQGIEMQEILQTAGSLPNLCRLKPRSCDIPSGSY